MEESRKLTQQIPSEQTSTAQASAPERQEQLPKKDYRCPKLELLGDVRIVTHYT
jgi:hypothetical protein